MVSQAGLPHGPGPNGAGFSQTIVGFVSSVKTDLAEGITDLLFCGVSGSCVRAMQARRFDGKGVSRQYVESIVRGPERWGM